MPVSSPIGTDFSVGDRTYRISEMLVFPASFRLWIFPTNEAAKQTELGVIAESASIALTDNTGTSYRAIGGATSFDNLSPRGHEWRQYNFAGRVRRRSLP